MSLKPDFDLFRAIVIANLITFFPDHKIKFAKSVAMVKIADKMGCQVSFLIILETMKVWKVVNHF